MGAAFAPRILPQKQPDLISHDDNAKIVLSEYLVPGSKIENVSSHYFNGQVFRIVLNRLECV